MVTQSPKNKRENRCSRYVGVSVLLAVFSGLLLLGSCNSTPDDIAAITGVEKATVRDTTSYADALSFSPSTYSFDPLVAGLGSADKVIVLTNTLSQDVYISSISGAKAPFSIATTDCPAPSAALQSGKSCSAKVTFAPTEEGKFSMVLRVDFGIAANGSELSASTGLTGTGSSSAAVGNAALSFSPTSNDFGAVRAGSGTSTKEIEVTNTAALPIFISAITKTNLNYSIPTDTCPRTPTALSPGAKCMITTRFAPLTGGESSTNVKVTYGLLAGDNNFSATVNLVGTGVGALDFPGLETANPVTTTTASLNWTHVTGAQNYFVYSLSGAGVATLVATVTPPTATYNLTGLTASTSYTYFVKAMDQLGTQDTNSATVAFTTKTLGSFASISNMSVAEAATGLTAALNCSDSYSSTPTYTITSQSDSDGTCTLTTAPIKVSCTPAYKTGHSSWTSAVAVQCALNGSTFTQSFTLTATDTNRSPALDAIADSSMIAGTAMTAINAADGGDDFDVDLDALTYSCTFSGGGFSAGTVCTSLPGTPSFTAATGALTWTPSIAAAVGSANTIYTIIITGSDVQATPLTNAKTIAVTVLPAVPANYVSIPAARSGLSYNYSIMQYEASLSAGSLGADTVTNTEADLSTCNYKFNVNETAADSTCGTKNTTKAAVSAAGATAGVSVTWQQAFWACRNASDSNFMVRLATREEWLRAAKWTGTYASMRTAYTANTGTNCAVGSGSASNTGAQSSCKTDLNIYDMAGNVSEWVDERMTAYSISGASETRFSYGPTIGRILKNGIDNLTRRYHQVTPGANDLALALGANFSNTATYGKQYGHEVESWQDPTVGTTTTGFRCVAFPKGQMPTVTQLALPAEPIYTSADLPASTANWKVPENLYLKDTKPEAVTITVTQANASNTTVAEGSVSLTWDAWSKCTSALAGGCTSSTSGITYEVYRYIEPVKQDIRMATIWALNETDAGGTAATNPYATSTPMDPLAVDSANARLMSPVASGSDITCTSGVCSWTDNVSFDTKRLYNYLVVAKDSSGSAVPARIQMYRSPYFTGDKASVASAFFRTELRLRRASVMLVDEDFQQAQTNPQIMVHVPLDKSGLDHDFYIQKYEAASTAGVTNDTGAANNPESAVGMNSNTWKNNAAVCQETFLRTMSFSASCGTFTSNSNGTVLLSKQGTTPVINLNQGHLWRACHNTGVSDGSGSPYYLALPTNAEWNKAADWGDVDLTGTIKQHVLPALVGTTISSLEYTVSSPSGTCNSGTSAASTSATAARLNCQSRYGVSEVIGSVVEYVLDRMYGNTGLDNGVDGLWLSHALKASDSQNSSPAGFDLLRGTVPANKIAGADIASGKNSDGYYQSATIAAPRRGGRWDFGTEIGRWFMTLNSPPSLTGATIGTRCSR